MFTQTFYTSYNIGSKFPYSLHQCFSRFLISILLYRSSTRICSIKSIVIVSVIYNKRSRPFIVRYDTGDRVKAKNSKSNEKANMRKFWAIYKKI